MTLHRLRLPAACYTVMITLANSGGISILSWPTTCLHISNV